MLTSFAKFALTAAMLSLALTATAAHAAPSTSKPVQSSADAAPAPGKVWFAYMFPENLKPQLEEKKMMLAVVGSLLPFGSLWGPMVFLKTSFDMEWALPVIVWSVLFPVWLAPMVMFANLNRPEIAVGEADAKK
jgi:hypothetical protein